MSTLWYLRTIVMTLGAVLTGILLDRNGIAGFATFGWIGGGIGAGLLLFTFVFSGWKRDPNTAAKGDKRTGN